jgi:hypothetical protein
MTTSPSLAGVRSPAHRRTLPRSSAAGVRDWLAFERRLRAGDRRKRPLSGVHRLEVRTGTADWA